MTCIVGLVDKGKVYMGSDSAGTAGHCQNIFKSPKVFKRGPFLFGGAGSWRGIQLLEYEVPLNKLLPVSEYLPKDNPLEAYLYAVTELIRETFKDKGHTEIVSNEENSDTNILLGIDGCLFNISYNFVVLETFNNYNCIGGGADYALGSLFESEDYGLEPKERVIRALECAENFCTGVKGPFKILCLNEDESFTDLSDDILPYKKDVD